LQVFLTAPKKERGETLKKCAPAIHFLLGSVAFVAAAVSVSAAPWPDGQEGVVDYLAEALAIDEFCDQYVIDREVAKTMLSSGGIADISKDPEAKAYYDSRHKSAWWASKSLGPKSCIGAEVFYGPEGTKHPRLLKRK
jgi:hypothetical protein